MIWMPLAMAGVGMEPIPAGTTVVSSHQTTLELPLDVRLAGRQFERRIDRTHTQQSAVVAEPDGFVVTWSENRHRAEEPGHTHDRVLPVVGHAYRSTGGKVSRVDGASVGEEEAEIVGQTSVLAQITTVRAMLPDAEGASRPAGPMFAGMLSDAPGTARVEGGTLTWRETRAGLAVFDVTLQLVAEGEDVRGARVETRVRGSGELWVRVDTGWTTRLDVRGAVDVEATRSDLQTTGRGTFTSVTTLEYR